MQLILIGESASECVARQLCALTEHRRSLAQLQHHAVNLGHVRQQRVHVCGLQEGVHLGACAWLRAWLWWFA